MLEELTARVAECRRALNEKQRVAMELAQDALAARRATEKAEAELAVFVDGLVGVKTEQIP